MKTGLDEMPKILSPKEKKSGRKNASLRKQIVHLRFISLWTVWSHGVSPQKIYGYKSENLYL